MKEESNIGAFQIGAISIFVGNALLIGFGVTRIITSAKNDAWMVPILSLVIGLIPLGIIMFLSNYHPDKNIFEKNKLIFGNIIGHIINFVLACYMLLILVLAIWTTTNFAVTIYLTKTPNTVIVILFLSVAIYALIKGLETICRVSQILFFAAIILMSIIVISLWPLSSFDNVKPILENGVMPVIFSSFKFLSFCLTPFIVFLAIPKNRVTDKKKFNKALLLGFIYCMVYMTITYYLINSVLTNQLASLYRYPAYYVQRKISIAGTINNLENFLSLHWFFDSFVLISMSLYFIKEYFRSTFKGVKKKSINKFIIIIGIIVTILPNYIFKNTVEALDFMNNLFHYIVSLVIFCILLLTFLIALIRKNKNKKS
jgi:spore germination protein KB